MSRALHILKNNNLCKEVPSLSGKDNSCFCFANFIVHCISGLIKHYQTIFFMNSLNWQQFWWTWGRKLVSLFTFQLIYGSSVQNSYLRTLMHYSANQAPYILINSIIVILVEFYYNIAPQHCSQWFFTQSHCWSKSKRCAQFNEQWTNVKALISLVTDRKASYIALQCTYHKPLSRHHWKNIISVSERVWGRRQQHLQSSELSLRTLHLVRSGSWNPGECSKEKGLKLISTHFYDLFFCFYKKYKNIIWIY